MITVINIFPFKDNVTSIYANENQEKLTITGLFFSVQYYLGGQ